MDLPVLADVPVKAKPAAAPPTETVEGRLATAFPGVMKQGAAVGDAAAGVQSEFGKQFARSYVESMLSEQFGFPVHIPDEEEAAYRRASRASAMAEMSKQHAESNASEAIKNTVNLMAENPEALKAAGISLGSITEEPEKFVAWANQNKLSPEPLKAGDLFVIGAGTPEFAQRLLSFDPEARAAAAEQAQAKAQQKAVGEAMTMESKALSLEAERAQQPAKMAKADEETAKLVEEYVSGDGVYGAGLKEATQGAESRYNVRLGRTLLHPFDVQSDEPNAPPAYFEAYNSEQKRVGSRFGTPSVVAQAFNKKYGSELADQIEEIPMDAQGNLIAGAGSAGVDPKASLGLIAFAKRMSRDLGQADVGELFQKWGIKASGVDDASFVQQLLTDSQKPDDMDTLREAAARLEEYGLDQEYGPILLKMALAVKSKAKAP